MTDPAAVEGSDAEAAIAFGEACRRLRRRISMFTALPLETLERQALKGHLDGIGRPAISPRPSPDRGRHAPRGDQAGQQDSAPVASASLEPPLQAFAPPAFVAAQPVGGGLGAVLARWLFEPDRMAAN